MLLRPYYNLVILERKAEEAYHACPGRVDRPALAIFRRTDVWEMPGDVNPTATPIGRHAMTPAPGRPLFPDAWNEV